MLRRFSFLETVVEVDSLTIPNAIARSGLYFTNVGSKRSINISALIS